MKCDLATHRSEDVCVNCVDLNNPPYVNTYSPHAAFKHKILAVLAKKFNLRTFVETGTNRGDTLAFLATIFDEDTGHHAFDHLHSIELHPDLYNYALSRFEKLECVHLVHGNSGKMLGSVLDKIAEPALLWIDAHPAGHGTADEGIPLEAELRTIYEKSPQSLIVIDDAWPQDFEKTVIPEGWHKQWYHGLTFIHKQGLYAIPERF